MTPSVPRVQAVRELNRHLVACPHCDTLYQRPVLGDNQRLRCTRCNSVVLTRKAAGAERLLAYMLASLILYVVAVSFPFLSMSKAGLSNQISVLSAVGILVQSDMLGLAALVGLFILVIPMVRIVLLMLAALVAHAKWRTGTAHALIIRIAQTVTPWSMAEIFMVGTTVSLVKVGKLATISTGPAFWALASLMIALALGTASMCRSTLWQYVRDGR